MSSAPLSQHMFNEALSIFSHKIDILHDHALRSIHSITAISDDPNALIVNIDDLLPSKVVLIIVTQ